MMLHVHNTIRQLSRSVYLHTTIKTYTALRFVLVIAFTSTQNVTGQPHDENTSKFSNFGKKLIWVKIETPTQAPHLPDLSWPTAITRPQKLLEELGNLRLVFKLQEIKSIFDLFKLI